MTSMASPRPIARHTPGPWEHDGTGLIYSMYVEEEGGTATFICDVTEDSTHAALCGPTPEEEANARLIAAAPELLEALQSVTHLLEGDAQDKVLAALTTATSL